MTKRARVAPAQSCSDSSPVRSRGVTSALPTARVFHRDISRTVVTCSLARPMSAVMSRARVSSSVASARVTGVSSTRTEASRKRSPSWRATRRTAVVAVATGIAGGHTRGRTSPTAAPMRVVRIRVSAAVFCSEAPRMSMALIGVSSACAPSRSALASRREAKITSARDHHESPTQIETTMATLIPVSTAPTRTSAIRAEPVALAWVTRIAVREQVRSIGPMVATRVMR